MGEMATTRGDLEGALRRHREAMATTAEAVERSPDNPQSLFDHAQNVFWVGYVDYQRGNLDKAAAAFREYRRLADRMVALAPENDKYRLERIYAESNLGTVLMDQRKYQEAANAYQRLLQPAEALLQKRPGNMDYQVKLLDALAWLADAREFSGAIDQAMAHRQRQLELLPRMWNSAEPVTELKRIEMTARRAMARLLAYRGQMDAAIEQSREASAVISWLTRTEPQNTEWMQAGAQANFERSGLELAANQLEGARFAANDACAAAARLVARDRSVAAWRTDLQLRCLRAKQRIALRDGDTAAAVSLSQQGVALAQTEKDGIERGLAMSSAEMALGEALQRTSQAAAAQGAYSRALEAWPRKVELRPRELADRAILLRRLGRTKEADEIGRGLASMGFRHPDYLRGRLQS